MSNIASPGSGGLELIKRIEALEREVAGLKGIVLWENPDPDVAFSEQDIILSSADYTRCDIFYKTFNQMLCQSIYKGFDTVLSSADGNAIDSHVRIRYRFIMYINDTKLHVSNANNAIYNTTYEQNDIVVPFRIIGYK